ncbi:hypothetical protein [Rubripirellula obstinata]|uniref:hypothetical protein n=1 Tax=Rubripirellula obstinata TaxID=406547 RepID=UPI00138F9FF5|nr:hypothetical protein [Rubripirellula obstinata]
MNTAPQVPVAPFDGPPSSQQPNLGPPSLDPFDADRFGDANAFGNQDFDFSDSGATRESFSSAPTIMGDSPGGVVKGLRGSITLRRQITAQGFNLSGTPGTPGAVVGFDASPFGGSPSDVFTTGLGTDVSGDGLTNVDTFSIAEPLPTSDAPGSFGPGFNFDGGTATYVGSGGGTTAVNGLYTDGENWFLDYGYTANLGGSGSGSGSGSGGGGGSGSGSGNEQPVPGPGIAVRRIKIAENYSPDVRDRLYLNYSFFNNFQGNLGDISRVIMGMERVLFEDLVSIEYRLPVAGTFGSTQTLGEAERRALEIGNASAILKTILLRGQDYIWAAGLGVSVPLASDTSLRASNDEEILRVENETFHIQPFTGLLYRPSDQWAVQGLLQFDFAAGADSVFANIGGGVLPEIGQFSDSTLGSLDIAATRTMFQGDRTDILQEWLVNLELHYLATMEESDFVMRDNITYENLADNFNILNLTVGSHFVFNNDLVLSPGISVPLRDGTDKQFDYEALVQLNYFR